MLVATRLKSGDTHANTRKRSIMIAYYKTWNDVCVRDALRRELGNMRSGSILEVRVKQMGFVTI